MPEPSSGAVSATGRRKTSVAQVRIIPNGQGKIQVNSRDAEEFFRGHERHLKAVRSPFEKSEQKGFDVSVKVLGGGVTGQAEAIRHGIARALAKVDDRFKKIMRKEGLLTRDPRMVERKKPGRPKARKRFQYSKR
jgi:small subunit ribosomal protein S9